MDHRTLSIWDNWREQIWSTYVRLESCSDDDGFFGRVERPNPASARLSRVISTRQITERTPSHLRSDPNEVVLVAVQIRGEGFIEQDDRRSCLGVGDFGFYETTRPYRLAFDGPFEQLIVKIPRWRLDCRMPQLNRLTGRRFEGRRGPGAVAVGHMLQLAATAGGLNDDDLESFEGATADLLATAVQLSLSGETVAERARFEPIKRRLAAALGDPNLNLEEFSAAVGLSPRGLQRLFQLDGTTFTRFVLRSRLQRIADDLRNPAHGERSITDIALGWGFNDLSYFSRAFRNAFGESARAWRAGV